jgi:toxin-antitoxin system PIN domain toxin
MKKTLLPDVNVWFALVFNAHVHHSAALAWFNGLTSEICHFCRLTQLSFLRLANNPKVFPKDAVAVAVAWHLYDSALGDQRVSFAIEPVGLESALRQLTGGRQFTPKLWNDAYLAAFAQAGGNEVVTFDQGFIQYTGTAIKLLP